MGYHFYCPYCGHLQLKERTQCCGCGKITYMTQSKFEAGHYGVLSAQKYNGDTTHWKEFLLEEVSQNPLYDEKIYNSVEAKAFRDKQFNQLMNNCKKEAMTNITSSAPKCPICNSTRLKKISAAKRGLHAWAFGIFSKTAFSQFECKDCGYKF